MKDLHFEAATYLQHQMALPEGWKREIVAQRVDLDRETV
jgi:hypothetical protein